MITIGDNIYDITQKIRKGWKKIPKCALQSGYATKTDIVTFFGIDEKTEKGKQLIDIIVNLPCIETKNGEYCLKNQDIVESVKFKEISNDEMKPIISPLAILKIPVPDPRIDCENIPSKSLYLLNKSQYRCKNCRNYDNYHCDLFDIKKNPFEPACHDIKVLKTS